MFKLNRPIYLCITALSLAATSFLLAAPKRYPYEESNSTELRELRDSLQDLKHEVHNHEVEIRTFEEKFSSLDTSLEALRQEHSESYQTHKENLKGNSASLEIKLGSIEATSKGLSADMRQLKTHANDTSNTLAQYEEKIRRLEKVIEAQNQNIASLESAIHSLADAIQIKDSLRDSPPEKKEPIVIKKQSIAEKGGSKIYTVKSGDSLGKIASENGTTIKAIKELNQFSKDQIFVGQTILLP